MTSNKSAAKLFEVLRAENIVEQHFRHLSDRTRASDDHLLDSLSRTYREALIFELSTAYSDTELEGLADTIAVSQAFPEDFEVWLKPAIFRSLQTAADTHINNRSGNSDFGLRVPVCLRRR